MARDWVYCVRSGVFSSRFSWPQPCHARSDGAEPLREARPGPRLDLFVAHLGLRAGGFEVLEPGVRLLYQQQLFGFVPGSYAPTSGLCRKGRTRTGRQGPWLFWLFAKDPVAVGASGLAAVGASVDRPEHRVSGRPYRRRITASPPS